jgi:hypothetical protein
MRSATNVPVEVARQARPARLGPGSSRAQITCARRVPAPLRVVLSSWIRQVVELVQVPRRPAVVACPCDPFGHPGPTPARPGHPAAARLEFGCQQIDAQDEEDPAGHDREHAAQERQCHAAEHGQCHTELTPRATLGSVSQPRGGRLLMVAPARLVVHAPTNGVSWQRNQGARGVLARFATVHRGPDMRPCPRTQIWVPMKSSARCRPVGGWPINPCGGLLRPEKAPPIGRAGVCRHGEQSAGKDPANLSNVGRRSKVACS